MVIWIIGLSGSGKSTLANKIIDDLKAKSNPTFKKTILLDGDVIREMFDNDLGYSIEDRLINAQRICKLGKFLDSQGVNVICAILSIFPETRQWNRSNIKNYYEVYIDSPITTLIKRDSKGIYGKYNRGEITEVAGMDIKFFKPIKADLVIDNSTTVSHLLSYSDKLIDLLCQ